MNLIIATCRQGHIQEQPLDVTQTRQAQHQIQARELTCKDCPEPLVNYMTRYDNDLTCCCNPTERTLHYNDDYLLGTYCCPTCLNSPNTIHCKQDIQ